MGRDLRIHPSIGIARVGNSPDGYFVGPERVGDFDRPKQGFRDEHGRLKRQGARFRVFEHFPDGSAREVSPGEAKITWHVTLANRKAAGPRFLSYPSFLKLKDKKGSAKAAMDGFPLRNKKIKKDRSSLVLGPASATLVPDAKEPQDIQHSGCFFGRTLKAPITLGRLQHDEDGRLLVLGGYGLAGSPVGEPLSLNPNDFADQDGWYDDTSDGQVTATVQFAHAPEEPVQVEGAAWLVVVPPKFAPAFQTPVTLYDALLQRAVDKGLRKVPSDQPSFTRDIFPILRRASQVRWTFADGQRQGSPNGFHSFQMALVALPAQAKRFLLSKLSIPQERQGSPGIGPGTMPKNWSENYPDGGGSLTRVQYTMLERWAAGDVVEDWKGTPWVESGDSADGLDRAALEACVGAPLYPGIEVGWWLREELPFVDAFRLAPGVQPGDVTASMSVPWQSDFLQCSSEQPDGSFDELPWWPAQRPIDVWQCDMCDPLKWARSFYQPGEMTLKEMIAEWHRLGFVLEDKQGVFLETLRV